MSILKNRKAFTLVEIIVATVIVSLIFSLASSLIWMSFRISHRTKEVSLKYSGLRNVLETMASDLRSASCFDYGDLDNFNLDSKEKKISFWITLPPEIVGSAYNLPIARVSYFSKQEGLEFRLYKTIESVFENYEEELFMLKGDFDFKVLRYDERKESLIELDDYSGAEIPPAVKIKYLSGDNSAERVIFIPYAFKI